MYQSLLAEIGRGRNLAPAAIQASVDAQGLIGAEAAKQAHLVDRVMYRDQLLDELKAATGRTGAKEPFKQIAPWRSILMMQPENGDGVGQTASPSSMPRAKSSTAMATRERWAASNFRRSCANCGRTARSRRLSCG